MSQETIYPETSMGVVDLRAHAEAVTDACWAVLASWIVERRKSLKRQLECSVDPDDVTRSQRISENV